MIGIKAAQSKKNTRQNFLHGAAILVGATAIVKVIGAIFKIPLGNLIGETGMGYFQTAYDLYLPIYSLAMAGLPVAVSKMVAESVAQNRYRDARSLLRIARYSFLTTGLIGFFVMMAITYPYIALTNNSIRTLPGLLAIAPSILFCCMMSAYRGYYEGLRNMTPTAVSQVIEAIGKLFLGLGLAFVVQKLGWGVEYQAAAAILGITVGTLFGAVYLSLRYRISSDGITQEDLLGSPQEKRSSELLRGLIRIAIPVVLGSLVVNIASLVDVTTVQFRLSQVVENDLDTLKEMYPQMYQALLRDSASEADAIANIPTYLYGCYKGFAYSIYNLVPTITSVLGVSALPALASAWAARRRDEVRINMESVLRITALLSFPCGIGMAVLSEPILGLLYPSKPIGASISAPILVVLGVAAVFAGLAMPLTNMLQGIGKQNLPLRNIAVGAVLKIICNYILVGIPSVNVHGAPVGTAVCYGYIFFMNLYYLIKYTKIRPSFWKTLLKPLIAAVISCACGYAAFHVLFEKLLISSRISVILAIVFTAFVYLLCVIFLKILTKEDVLMLPKGQKIGKVLEKRHWIC